jgi:predicted enzyme related to lactoylglutathione lyase
MSQAATAPAKTPFAYTGEVTISVNVKDMNASIDWYGKAFGFELIYKLDEWGWCELSTPRPGVHVGLGQTADPIEAATAPYFAVADIEAAKRHLESVGATFTEEIHEIEGMVKLAGFKDPDGNPFGLAQSLT